MATTERIVSFSIPMVFKEGSLPAGDHSGRVMVLGIELVPTPVVRLLDSSGKSVIVHSQYRRPRLPSDLQFRESPPRVHGCVWSVQAVAAYQVRLTYEPGVCLSPPWWY